LITKKDLVVSVLCTFCLTTVLFTMMPVQSAEWDPWLDVKEDGRINVLDLIKTAGALGTMGDTTKNVNVTNWPSKTNANVTNWPSTYSAQQTGIMNLSWSSYDAVFFYPGQTFDMRGFSRISILITVLDVSKSSFSARLTPYVLMWQAASEVWPTSFYQNVAGTNTNSVYIQAYGVSFSAGGYDGLDSFETKAPRVEISYRLMGQTVPQGWIQFRATIYLRNE